MFRPVKGKIILAASLLAMSSGTAATMIDGPSRLHPNVGAVPIDQYTANNTGQFANCPADPYPKVQDCYKSLLQKFKSQEASGVRFRFSVWRAMEKVGSDYQVKSSWLNNLDAFLQDIKNQGYTYVTPSPMFSGTLGEGEQVIGDAEVLDSGCPDNKGALITLTFWPTAPFGWDANGPYAAGYDKSYNCSPENPIFVGWDNIYEVIDALLAKVAAKGLVVYEFDLLNEMNLHWFTVEARFIYDNVTGHSGDRDVLTKVRSLMSQYGFSPDRVTYSAATSRTSSPGGECLSIYGDSARLIALSEVTAGINGGLVGHGIGWTDRDSSAMFLPCRAGETKTIDMAHLPVYHTQPSLIDVHDYSCLLATKHACDLSKTSADTYLEAKTVFTRIREYRTAYCPGGWHGYNPNICNAQVIVGETHSNTSNGNQTCEGAPLNSAEGEVLGYNDSTLAGTTTIVMQPWYHAVGGCYPFGNPVINPPYDPTLQD